MFDRCHCWSNQQDVSSDLDADSDSPQKKYQLSWCKNIADADDDDANDDDADDVDADDMDVDADADADADVDSHRTRCPPAPPKKAPSHC